MTFPIRLFLTLSLLATTREPAEWELPMIRQELTALLVAGEVMDARELPYIFAKPSEIADDMKLIRRRMEDLDGAPSVNAHMAFAVQRDTINMMLAMNRDYTNWLRLGEEVYPGYPWFAHAMEENKQLYDAWDWLRDGKTDFYYVHIRRQSLKKLQGVLGVGAFERGIMPPCLPAWRMTGVRNW